MAPGGLGFAANWPIRLMMSWRNFFCSMASISFTAERLIETLYFSTPFQILYDVFIGQAWFVYSIFKGSKILGIFRKA